MTPNSNQQTHPFPPLSFTTGPSASADRCSADLSEPVCASPNSILPGDLGRRDGSRRVSVKFLCHVLGSSETLFYRDRRAHYAPFDLALAALEVIVTAHVAFAACVVLGGVLLQTAPPMIPPNMSKGGLMVPVGISGPAGRMETFWRVVREVRKAKVYPGETSELKRNRLSVMSTSYIYRHHTSGRLYLLDNNDPWMCPHRRLTSLTPTYTRMVMLIIPILLTMIHMRMVTRVITSILRAICARHRLHSSSLSHHTCGQACQILTFLR